MKLLDIEALTAMIRPLPGRVAGLVHVDAPSKGLIELPDAVRAKDMHLELPPFPVARNLCVASGITNIQPGDYFASMPLEGLWINSDDPDLPEIGALVPEGYQLRLYGVNTPLDSQVLCRLGDSNA